MIAGLPIAVFLAGTVVAYLRDGRPRVAATMALLVATGASLALVTDAGVGASWLIGPVLATLLVSRGHPEGRLSFEALTRRAITLATAGLVAVFVATKFPLGENPALLSVVPWLLGALGAAWLVSPVDARERTQGQVLLLSAGAALLIAASPVGGFTAAASGAMALVPAIAARFDLPPRSHWIAVGIALLAAAVIALLALVAGTLPHPAFRDLTFSLDGAALPAAALLLVIGALAAPQARGWLVLPALVAVLAAAPSLRWAALAAVVAGQVDADTRALRAAWLALLALASSTLFALLTTQPWSPRAQIVGLAAALVLMAVGFYGRGSVLVLATAALLIVEDTVKANAGLMGHFQWVTAAGAALLVARALLARRDGAAAGSRVDEQVTLGLLLVAVGAHDPLGLGSLAVLLLLVDLALVRQGPAAFGALDPSHPMRWVVDLSTSGWPSTVRFAGVTLAVIAALQTSLGWGLLSAALLIAIKLGPVIEPVDSAEPARARLSIRALVAPAVALACGIAPALLLRMLRV
ncbi:MAG: hypothetical protein M3Z11_04450 [Candidatus Dormibacteraeota bacterium]|nr:hypothetical protein [Candidatus Dormibacteraeota bacterium]